ncbi:hypothetical protein ABKN59_005872 [Abortiporus biennis]
MAQSSTEPNSLGLDLQSLKISDETPPAPAAVDTTTSPPKPEEKPEQAQDVQTPVSAHAESPTEGKSPIQTDAKGNAKKEKKQPYVNPDRVKTGGAQRDKLTEEELTERMVRIREQNEKIKQRREDVKKDEDEFRKTQEAERVKQAKNKKVQESINRTREQNARRKLDKIEAREWDSGKTPSHWKDSKAANPNNTERIPTAPIGIRGGISGNAARGRGRGRGGGPVKTGTSPVEDDKTEKLVPAVEPTPAPATTEATASS